MPSLNQLLMVQTAKQRYEAATRTAKTTLLSRTSPTIGAHRARPAPNPGATIEPICKAICYGHDLWRMQAQFKGIVIMGPNATGGRIEGPDLGQLIRSSPEISRPGDAQTYGKAVAGALGQAWSIFAASVRVPSLPWYPSFVAFPGPQAPPTPNVPTPLIACTCNRSALEASRLASDMTRQLRSPDPAAAALFDALARGFSSVLDLWLAGQMIVNVMGTGPVPGFAPPYVPVGPVVNGSVIPTGPHLST